MKEIYEILLSVLRWSSLSIVLISSHDPNLVYIAHKVYFTTTVKKLEAVYLILIYKRCVMDIRYSNTRKGSFRLDTYIFRYSNNFTLFPPPPHISFKIQIPVFYLFLPFLWTPNYI